MPSLTFKKQLNFWSIPVVFLIFAVLSFSVIFGKTSMRSLQYPIGYNSDYLFHFGMFKQYSEMDFIDLFRPKLSNKLGYPYAKDSHLSDFPITEEFEYFFVGKLSNLVGLWLATNIMLIIVIFLNSLSMFCALKTNKVSSFYSFLLAIIYALSPYFLARNLIHLTLSMYFCLPWVVLVCREAIQKYSLGLLSRKQIYLICFLLGLFNPYYLLFFLVSFLICTLISQIRNLSLTNLKIPLVAVLCSFSAFLFMHLDTLITFLEFGGNRGALTRSLGEIELYGLKITELLIPGWSKFRFLQKYSDWYYSSAFIKPERMGSSYLGIIGIIGFFGLFFGSIFQALKERKVPYLFELFGSAWVLSFSMVGGLAGILGALGLFTFRANNRLSIFIFTLIIFYIGSFMTNYKRGWQKIIFASIFILTLFESFPSEFRKQSNYISMKVDEDLNLCRTLEKNFEPGSALINFPLVLFPESPKVHLMDDYEHFRPYLCSESFSYTYGSVKGRGLEDWQKNLDTFDSKHINDVLKSKNIKGVLIYRKGYPDAGKDLIVKLTTLGFKIVGDPELSDFITLKILKFD